MRVLSPFKPGDIPGRKKKAYTVSTSNHGHVVRSRRAHHAPRSNIPKDIERVYIRTPWSKWRRLWLAAITDIWKNVMTGSDRAWWIAQRSSVLFPNYKNVLKHGTAFQLFVWYQFRWFDLDLDRYIPFPTNKADFPHRFSPPWAPPTLEAPTIVSALPGPPGATDPNLCANALTAPGAAVPWNDPENVCTYDDSVASCTLTSVPGQEISQEIQAYNWEVDPEIPIGSTIVGIDASVMCQEIGAFDGVQDNTVRLMRRGIPVGENKAQYTWTHDQLWPWTYQVYGGPTDLWKTTWTREDLYNIGFGLAFSGKRTGLNLYDDAQIAQLEIRAYYTAPPTVKVRCLNKAPDGTILAPFACFSLHPPANGNPRIGRNAFAWSAKDDENDHSVYTYYQALAIKGIRHATQAALTHCYCLRETAPISVTKSPTIARNEPYDTAPWLNPDNIFVSDAIYAASAITNTSTDNIVASGFNPAIPAAATPLGITVRIQRRDTLTSTLRLYCSVYGPGEVPSGGKTSLIPWPADEEYITLGAPTDLWDTVWEIADWNDPDFAVWVRGESNYTPGLPEIDHVEVTFTYKLTLDQFTLPTHTRFEYS